MADSNVNSALLFLGKSVTGLASFPDDPDSPHPFSGMVVGVVVPSPGSRVSLQLLMQGSGNAHSEGYEYELFWDTILLLAES